MSFDDGQGSPPPIKSQYSERQTLLISQSTLIKEATSFVVHVLRNISISILWRKKKLFVWCLFVFVVTYSNRLTFFYTFEVKRHLLDIYLLYEFLKTLC